MSVLTLSAPLGDRWGPGFGMARSGTPAARLYHFDAPSPRNQGLSGPGLRQRVRTARLNAGLSFRC